ncbi:MAG: S1C family serine protease [Phycisphaerae bacterium]
MLVPLMLLSGCTAFQANNQTVIVGLNELVRLESDFQQVIDDVSPSVVGIRVLRRTSFSFPLFESSSKNSEVQQLVAVNGSGMILTADGLILTNEHVIRGGDRIVVIRNNGFEHDAELVSADPRADLAVLRIPVSGLVPVRFTHEREVRRGQWNVAVGNPYGFGRDGKFCASVGVVSNTSRALPELGIEDDRHYTDMIQTTASINPGNSGGPLFNLRGDVIGIVTAMYLRNPGEEGAGFAIPLSAATRQRIQQLCTGGSVDYGYFGVTVRRLEPNEARSLQLPKGVGVRVIDVDVEGPAARAGIRSQDVIVEYEGRVVASPEDLVAMASQARIGRRASVLARRGHERIETTMVISRRDPTRVASIR